MVSVLSSAFDHAENATFTNSHIDISTNITQVQAHRIGAYQIHERYILYIKKHLSIQD